MAIKRILGVMLLAAIAGGGCIKKGDLNFKNIQVDNWQPDWALPILSAKMTLSNVLKTGSVLSEDAAGLYSLHYKGSLFTAKAADYILIPDQNYTTPGIPLSIPQSTPSFTGSITDSASNHFTFTDTSGAQLAHIAIKSGNIKMDLNTTFKQNISMQLTFPNITNSSGTPLRVTAAINYPGNTATVSANLAGYTVDMTNGGATKNYMAYKVRFTVAGTGQPLNPGDNIMANIAMTGIQYSFIDGFMGRFSIPIPSDTINVGVFDNTMNANIYIRNPKINLSFSNSFGLDVAAKFDQVYGMTNKGQVVNMNLNPVTVYGAATQGVAKTTEFTIDSTNSSVQNMFNPAPNIVVYNGRMLINPTPGTTYNFVTDASTIELKADAELPAWFQIIDFSLQDTVKLILPEDTSLLQKAEFKMLMDNAFPLYGSVQLYFADENYKVIDSLIQSADNIIGEAPVDANGVVNGRTSAVTRFIMEHDKYNAMAPKVRHALVRGHMKTSGKGDIKILSSSNLAIKLAFRFTLNVSSTDL